MEEKKDQKREVETKAKLLKLERADMKEGKGVESGTTRTNDETEGELQYWNTFYSIYPWSSKYCAQTTTAAQSSLV